MTALIEYYGIRNDDRIQYNVTMRAGTQFQMKM